MCAMAENRAQRLRAAGVACLVLLALPATAAQAEDLLGPYLGATIGKSELDITTSTVSHFGSSHSAFKVLIGARPISEVGVEVAYVDLGHPSEQSTAPFSPVTIATDASIKGIAAFGILYLPTPLLDFYLKGGLARLTTKVNMSVVGCTTGPPCPPATAIPPVDSTDTALTGGVGAQFKISSFSLRAEYERFNAGGGNPYLVSLGATWMF
jgi:hypothetical protein